MLKLTKGSDLELKAVNWLWPGVLVNNAFGTLSGFPGVNKSTLSQYAVATITTGSSWPLSDENAPLGNCIILNGEEDANADVAPRLKAMGADASRYSVTRKQDIGDFNLTDKLDLLVGSIEDMGDVRLIVIDTLDSFLGDANTNSSGDVSRITNQLAAIAEKYKVCILGICHLNKDSNKEVIGRVSGSMSWVGKGRFNKLLSKDREIKDKRYLTEIKTNRAPDGEGYSFTLRDVTLGLDPEINKPITGLVTENWEPYSGSSQELLDIPRPGPTTKTGAAEDMILALLAMGRMGKDNLETILKSEDISPGTLRVAIRNLQNQDLVDKEKEGGVHGPWYWKLKEAPEQSSSSDTPKSVEREKTTTPETSNPTNLTPYLQRLKEAEERRKEWALEKQKTLQAA
jgi:hypothetical protein